MANKKRSSDPLGASDRLADLCHRLDESGARLDLDDEAIARVTADDDGDDTATQTTVDGGPGRSGASRFSSPIRVEMSSAVNRGMRRERERVVEYLLERSRARATQGAERSDEGDYDQMRICNAEAAVLRRAAEFIEAGRHRFLDEVTRG